MEREEFIKKVSLLDKKQGNFQNTLKLMEKGKVDRVGYLSKYPDNAIDFFEWALNNGEKVFVFEDIYRPNGKFHTHAHFVFPDYQMCVMIETESRTFEKSIHCKQFIYQLSSMGFVFFIKPNDTLEEIVAYFERVKGYFRESPRAGFKGTIVKPERKKRQRIKIVKSERVL